MAIWSGPCISVYHHSMVWIPIWSRTQFHGIYIPICTRFYQVKIGKKGVWNFGRRIAISTASWQNQQNCMCAHRRLRSAWASAQSDQSLRCPQRLIWVFAVRLKKPWVLSYPLSAQRRLWSDWAYSQADVSHHWAYSHFVGFVMKWLISLLIMVQKQRKED